MKQRRADQRDYHFIYKTTYLVTGKYYCGMHSTDDLEDGYLGSGLWLRRSVKKYGKEAHKREILQFLPNRKSLREHENKFVDQSMIDDSLCMNLRLGGGGPVEYQLGKKRSDETCKKISEALKGRKLSIDHRRKLSEKKRGENHPFFGKSSPMKGKTHSADTRARLSGITGEKHHAFGKKFSEEHRQRLSESHTGLKQSLETIEKRVSKLRGKKHSDETKAMLREKALQQWARDKGRVPDAYEVIK